MKTTGALLLADISGFDEYLAGVELEHAGGVLRELIELLIEALRPSFLPASVEGDALLTHAPAGAAPQGAALVALLEHTYLTFKQRLASIRRNSTCNCRACEAVPQLDLKFLVHAGEYSSQSRDGRAVLGGLAANLVQERLLKDQAPPDLRGYALFTEQAVKALALDLPKSPRRAHAYPGYGEVATRLIDLAARLPALELAARQRLTPATATLHLVYDYTQSRERLWDWLNDPHKRTRWMVARTWTALARPGGRLAVGATNHCAHGLGSLIETVVDWQPPDYFTVTLSQPSLKVDAVLTYDLSTMPGGQTRLNLFARPGPAGSPWLEYRPFLAMMKSLFASDYRRLGRLMAAEDAEPSG